MKLDFLTLSPDERGVYFGEAAARRDVSAVMLEKDFWVCWLLGVLFTSPFAEDIVFKGGTSLSKVFGVIDRFSEDIDLSVSPAFLGLSEREPKSRNQAHKWMQTAEAACSAIVQDRLMPALEAAVSDALGAGRWLEFQVDPHTHSPILYFRYPTSQPPGFSYLARTVKIEFGSLTDQQPTGHHSVRPWVADALPQAFKDWQCDVVALELERTFWEKATILHAEFHRPLDRPAPDRFSRHYADVAALAVHPDAGRVIARTDLCLRVAEWKARFFGSAWSNYDAARPGTFRLVPNTKRSESLRRDYAAMGEMYLSEPPTFDEVLATLSALERQINALP